MNALQNLKKSLTDPTPFYAAVGAADLAVARVVAVSDEAGKRAAELRAQLKPQALAGKAQQAANETVEQVQALPKQLETQRKATVAQAEESYVGLSKRGADVVAALWNQEQTQQVVGQGKATVAGVRKAAEDGQDLATKAVLAGRKEAAKQVEAVADSAQSAAGKFGAEAGKLGDEARTEVRSSAARYGAVDAKPAKPAKPAKKAPAKRTAKKSPAKRTAKKAPARKSSASKTTASTAKKA
ncbi:hypothetical protein [Barrientosiimonas humi]|uniref:hypothetical protein n=1 Tax=Barrientosiimonas humi TaxID=999931 RepID=UPI00370DE234